MPRRKRKRSGDRDDRGAAQAAEAVGALRAATGGAYEALAAELGARASPARRVTPEGLLQAVRAVAAAGGADGAAGEVQEDLEAAAQTVHAMAVRHEAAAKRRRAAAAGEPRAPAGEQPAAAAAEAEMGEVLWLVQHHGAPRGERPASRRDAPGGAAGADTAGYEQYYRQQGIVPEEEWDDFAAALRRPLPMVLRLSASRPYHAAVRRAAEAHAGASGAAVQSLPWAGSAGALQCAHSHFHSPEGKAFHDWCRDMNALGAACFQEAASMLPPLLLDPRHGDLVLDLCAAPGSKTLQTLDLMQQDARRCGQPLTGAVWANELDKTKATQVLPARMKRSHSAACIITQGDARHFPVLWEHLTAEGGACTRPMLFDRVLADVPCTGDATVRKEASVWRTWSVRYAQRLHSQQLQILQRGLLMLRTGGRLVYSTCSFNPAEDEAVVSAALAAQGGTVRLVDPEQLEHGPAVLRGVRPAPGVHTWKVSAGDGQLYSARADVPEGLRADLASTLFPPAEAAIQEQLPRCMRVLPHRADTGGFFVAVFERVSPAPGHERLYESSQLPRRLRMQQARAAAEGGTPPAAQLAGSGSEGEEGEPPAPQPAAAPAAPRPRAGRGVAALMSSRRKPAGPADAVSGLDLLRRAQQGCGGVPALSGLRDARRWVPMLQPGECNWLWRPIAEWFGLDPDPSAALAPLVVLAQGGEHDRGVRPRIFVATPGVTRLQRALVPAGRGQAMRVMLVGTRVLARIRGGYLAGRCSCEYRGCFEAASELAAASTRRLLRASPAAFVRMLGNKGLPTAEVDQLAAAGELDGVQAAKDQGVGACLVGLQPHPALPPSGAGWDEVWAPCALVASKLETEVEDHERVGLRDLVASIAGVPVGPASPGAEAAAGGAAGGSRSGGEAP
eukprot:TRINITY_DN29124_c0_g1_i1.p1 TRINITY_DN29124_c0_g1~~TRINITY_DN29124_c0_g1_i1.p1  ORF type:complete len:926 (+),score=229.88 TRINITY_DN29124_c0_g1_i1:76-2778(+)